MSRVTIENLYKTYNSAKEVDESQIITNAVLKGINLQIQEGEFMVLVGPSGCGKSTLLRLIAGLEEISGGKIYIGDRIVNELPPQS